MLMMLRTSAFWTLFILASVNAQHLVHLPDAANPVGAIDDSAEPGEVLRVTPSLCSKSMWVLTVCYRIAVHSDSVFVPTHDWQEIKPGQSIPKGLHVRINLETGKKEAKLLEEFDQQQVRTMHALWLCLLV